MSTLPPVREWRLHIGAHKTATTHIQYRLEAMRGPLAEAGLDVMIPGSGTRRLGLRSMAEKPPKLWFMRARNTTPLTNRLATLRRGPDRVLLSDEMILGKPETLLEGRIYDDFSYIASMIGALGKTAPVHLFLCIRSLDTFLPSAYAQILRFHSPPAEGFDVVRRMAMERPLRWSDIVARLRRHAPRARLGIWRYEDYRDNADRIISEICGHHTLPKMPKVAPPDRTRSGSDAAVAAAAALPAGLGRHERWRRVATLYADPALAGPAFAPFSQSDQAHLRTLYEEDWGRITRRAPEAILDLR